MPYRRAGPKRRFGALRGAVSVGPEFFETLSGDELAPSDQLERMVLVSNEQAFGAYSARRLW